MQALAFVTLSFAPGGGGEEGGAVILHHRKVDISCVCRVARDVKRLVAQASASEFDGLSLLFRLFLLSARLVSERARAALSTLQGGTRQQCCVREHSGQWRKQVWGFSIPDFGTFCDHLVGTSIVLFVSGVGKSGGRRREVSCREACFSRDVHMNALSGVFSGVL